MIHGLGLGEFGDGWEDAEGVAGEEDDVGGVVGDAGDLGVVDEFDGVGSSGILGEGGVSKVDIVVVVVDDVFEDGSVVEGVVDIGFGFGAEVDGFGVASAFDVEDSGIGPDVFVVADEFAIWVGGEGGFAGAGEAEEDSGAIGLGICDGGAVHGEVAFLGHKEVHEGEDAFFHFARVFGAEDDHFFFLEADVDGGFGGHAGGEAVGGELSGVVDGEVGLAKVGEFFFRGGDEHDGHEEGVVGAGADDADLDSVLRVPACKGVDDVNLVTSVEVVLGSFAVDLKGVFVDGDVDIAPPDLVFGGGVFGDAFVAGGAARFFSRVGDEGSEGG